jgi:FAD/FMN-containing dehydrogenase
MLFVIPILGRDSGRHRVRMTFWTGEAKDVLEVDITDPEPIQHVSSVRFQVAGAMATEAMSEAQGSGFVGSVQYVPQELLFGPHLLEQMRAIALACADSWSFPPPVVNFRDSVNWVNWGQTLSSAPERIFSDDCPTGGKSPKSVADLQDIVRSAGKAKKTVRVFGSCHSWAPLAQTDAYLVDTRKIFFDQVQQKLTVQSLGDGLVKFSPGLTTGEFEERIWELGFELTLPASTVEDVFTMGGIVTTASHGTGRDTTCVSDLVTEMEIVCWDGKDAVLRTFSQGSVSPQVPGMEKVQLQDVFHAMQANLGLFGIIYSITMRLPKRYFVYWSCESVPWRTLFSDAEDCHQRLAELQKKWDTLEFFYFPMRMNGARLELSPDVTVLLVSKESPAAQGYNVVPYNPQRWQQQAIVQRFGAGIVGHLAPWFFAHPQLAGPFFGYVISLGNLGFVPAEKTAYEVPQFRANHALNAAGGVEPIRVLDIEWALPCDVRTAAGMKNPSSAFAHLLQSIGNAYESHSGLERFPVSVAAEMRLFGGSHCLISPVAGDMYCCAPEIISHAGNPGWVQFYQRMHTDLVRDFGGSGLKCHMAKMGWELPEFLKWTRSQYEASARKAGSTSGLVTFANICRLVDPDGLFRNPFLTQFLFSSAPTYKPPASLPMDASGKVPNPPPTDAERDTKRVKTGQLNDAE